MRAEIEALAERAISYDYVTKCIVYNRNVDAKECFRAPPHAGGRGSAGVLRRRAAAATGVWATQGLLIAAGVTAGKAAAASAVVNWVLKDGLGRLGCTSWRLGVLS